jgi:hypothetical protein
MKLKPPNPALHTDAPGLSRPLQLTRKGHASLRRAGKRERYAASIVVCRASRDALQLSGDKDFR